ncbi:hypothetical protein SAMD00024442_37_35 [Candidatus Symbiothrix dinenymphae]|nr:hypothetical protein SAMD00024442_37_35 [Candidatus Symbiothrix dinenymphae]
MEFVTSSTFEKSFKRLKKKYASFRDDVSTFKKEFSENPKIGTDLGGGYRKIRMAIKSKNSGKSGGARIIMYDFCIKEPDKDGVVLLADIYDKGEEETLKENIYKKIVENFLSGKEKTC